jgi:histidyl-tRNA synthetase
VLLALEAAGVTPVVEAPPVAVVVGSDPADTVTRLRIATELRAAGLAVRAELGPRKLGKQLEAAARDGAHFAVIIGDELAGGHVQLRDLEAGTQRATPVAGLARELERASKSHRHGEAQQRPDPGAPRAGLEL